MTALQIQGGRNPGSSTSPRDRAIQHAAFTQLPDSLPKSIDSLWQGNAESLLSLALARLPGTGPVYRILKDWQIECAPRFYPSTYKAGISSEKAHMDTELNIPPHANLSGLRGTDTEDHAAIFTQ
jgi:hypothetical protein